jgi:hypothetical protein
MMAYIIYLFLFVFGLTIGILNKMCLSYVINSGKFNKNILLLSSFIRILLVSLILFFIIKINYRFILPLFIGFSLSKFFIKKIRNKNEY